MWHCTIYRLHIGYTQHRVDNQWGEGDGLRVLGIDIEWVIRCEESNFCFDIKRKKVKFDKHFLALIIIDFFLADSLMF